MKARLLAVLLVSTLVLATAAPLALAQAFAGNNKAIAGDNQAIAGDDRATSGENDTERQYVNCSQVQIAIGGQYAAQGQYAAGDGDATAEIAEELDITQSQVNECLGGQTDDNNSDSNNADEEAEAAANEVEDGEDAVLAGTVPEDTLPDTGGPSLLVAAAGFALVLGGASLIRTGRGR